MKKALITSFIALLTLSSSAFAQEKVDLTASATPTKEPTAEDPNQD